MTSGWIIRHCSSGGREEKGTWNSNVRFFTGGFTALSFGRESTWRYLRNTAQSACKSQCRQAVVMPACRNAIKEKTGQFFLEFLFQINQQLCQNKLGIVSKSTGISAGITLFCWWRRHFFRNKARERARFAVRFLPPHPTNWPGAKRRPCEGDSWLKGKFNNIQ